LMWSHWHQHFLKSDGIYKRWGQFYPDSEDCMLAVAVWSKNVLRSDLCRLRT
jgi:hypothetical protein